MELLHVENFLTDECVDVLLDLFSLCPRLHNISIEGSWINEINSIRDGSDSKRCF